MDKILEQIAYCIEVGKKDRSSSYPRDLCDQDGADELTQRALAGGHSADVILERAFVAGMDRVGKKFARKEIFIPQMLMSATALHAAMRHLKPYFDSGEVRRRGTFIIGTVAGDVHDIGKNLVSMMIEGSGWKVIDLGVDVQADRFVDALRENPECLAIGLSAMLTTTMMNMEEIVRILRAECPDVNILIGGAPVNEPFRERIGADFYSKDSQGAVEYLNTVMAA